MQTFISRDCSAHDDDDIARRTMAKEEEKKSRRWKRRTERERMKEILRHSLISSFKPLLFCSLVLSFYTHFRSYIFSLFHFVRTHSHLSKHPRRYQKSFIYSRKLLPKNVCVSTHMEFILTNYSQYHL